MIPPAFLALWNGVVPERRVEYEAWHSVEHAPERLGAPGFRALSRYRAEGGEGYFTLYELDGPEALETRAYAALMERPTAWSARMRPALTGFRRLPCRTLFARRRGRGGALATLRIRGEAASLLPLVQGELEAMLAGGDLLGAVLGEAAAVGRAYAVFPDAPAPVVETLLLAEGTEPDAVAEAGRRIAALLQGHEIDLGQWRLLQALLRGELEDPDAARQPAREDLLGRWRCSGPAF